MCWRSAYARFAAAGSFSTFSQREMRSCSFSLPSMKVVWPIWISSARRAGSLLRSIRGVSVKESCRYTLGRFVRRTSATAVRAFSEMNWFSAVMTARRSSMRLSGSGLRRMSSTRRSNASAWISNASTPVAPLSVITRLTPAARSG